MERTFKISLSAARVNAGLSQEEAAKLCGVTRNTILNWENGKTKIKKTQAIGLAQIYDVPFEYIFLPDQFPNRKTHGKVK